MLGISPNRISKKRKYSRQGCLECKRRKIKCDESKPLCNNCCRIKKECSYKAVTKFKNKNPEIEVNTFLVVEPQIVNKETQIAPKDGDQYVGGQENSGKPSAPATSQAPESHMHVSGSEGPPLDGSDLLYSGASMLAHDLTDLLLFELKDFPDTTSSNDFNFYRELNTHISVPRLSAKKLPSLELFEDDSIASLIAAYDLISGHKNYLRLFYEKYSLWLMPLSPTSGPKNFLNKIIIQQALRQPFLLNAIFSIAASFEFQECRAAEDDYNKRFYVNLCLKSLSTMFDNKVMVAEYIEPLILTSLLLVTDSASALNGSWRTYLKGANDLFRQYLRLSKKNTPTILLATTWFASFEMIAVMANPLGGLISSPNQLDDILQPILYRDDWNLAIQLGLVLPNGYNVFLGMSSPTISLFIHFMKLSLKTRNSSKKGISSDELVELMSLFNNALAFSLASSDGRIHTDSPYYPRTSGLNFLPIETYGYKGNLVFSWFDSSDKTHLRALCLTILTNHMFVNLPKASNVVQDVVKKILDMCLFFEDIDFQDPDFDIERELAKPENSVLRDRRLFMFHSPLFICGLNTIDKIDRLKVELYFTSLMKLGNRTVESSLDKIKSHWSGGDGITDFVPYL